MKLQVIVSLDVSHRQPNVADGVSLCIGVLPGLEVPIPSQEDSEAIEDDDNDTAHEPTPSTCWPKSVGIGIPRRIAIRVAQFA